VNRDLSRSFRGRTLQRTNETKIGKENMKQNLSKLALAGLFTGSLVASACGGSEPTPDTATTEQSMEKGDHACGGKDACKGAEKCSGADAAEGADKAEHACGGKDACKGAKMATGAEASATYTEIHDCAGKNTCKGLGGCKVDAAKLATLATAAGVDAAAAGEAHDCGGKNSCKGLGGCHVDATKLATLKAAKAAATTAP